MEITKIILITITIFLYSCGNDYKPGSVPTPEKKKEISVKELNLAIGPNKGICDPDPRKNLGNQNVEKWLREQENRHSDVELFLGNNPRKIIDVGNGNAQMFLNKWDKVYLYTTTLTEKNVDDCLSLQGSSAFCFKLAPFSIKSTKF